MTDYFSKLDQYQKKSLLSEDLVDTLRQWHISYSEAALANGYTSEQVEPILVQFLDLVAEQIKHPYKFEPFHQRLKTPLDFYRLSLEFTRPLVIQKESKAFHLEFADKMTQQLQQGENVVLLANHQTELDPQAISLLLEKTHQRLAEEMIFVAGHRVVTDPLAVPFSKGCNLLCIYSKKYISDHPELKEDRLLHNQRTMKRMGQLLAEGGKCIYVAPSGGRDRPDRKGKLQVAPFDPQSIELFRLTADRAGRTTHFYPLSLKTYRLLPPPDNVKKNIGEPRVTTATPIFLAFGPEVDMQNFPGSGLVTDKAEKRKARAQYIWQQVKLGYDSFD